MKRHLLPVALAASLLAAAPGVLGTAGAQLDVGATSVGVEAGLPLVFGVDATFRTDPRWRFGVGLGRLSGLTALRAEARWLLRPEARGRVVPSLIAGVEQYFLNDGDLDATPVGVHAALGFDYLLDSPVSVGVRVGGLKTFGSSGGGDARVFSIRNGYESGLFNLGFRYHF